jgi:hypothetical protein
MASINHKYVQPKTDNIQFRCTCIGVCHPDGIRNEQNFVIFDLLLLCKMF